MKVFTDYRNVVYCKSPEIETGSFSGLSLLLFESSILKLPENDDTDVPLALVVPLTSTWCVLFCAARRDLRRHSTVKQ